MHITSKNAQQKEERERERLGSHCQGFQERERERKEEEPYHDGGRLPRFHQGDLQKSCCATMHLLKH